MIDPQAALVILLALGAGALVKGATGMGLPLIALPALTAAFGLQHAIGLMTVPLVATNLWQVWRFREHLGTQRLRFMPAFLVSGSLGVIAGTLLLTSLPDRLLVFGLGVILLLYVGLKLLAPPFSLGELAARRLGPLMGAGSGVLQGATGISSPIGVTFIHAMGLERDAHVFAVSAMFLVLSLVQLPALMAAGVMQPAWLLEGLLALAPILLLMPVGRWAATKLSPKGFDRLLLALLGIMGLKMVLGL